MNMRFSSFSVGDRCLFERVFDATEFAVFSSLSGDRNPMHHDLRHAATTPIGRTIVPLHMTASPLSRIAGMVFPGEPSLYLGHELRALRPVFYGDHLTYSARIQSINSAQRTLLLRVLAIREADVVLDASMRVQAMREEWSSTGGLPILQAGARACAVVTGASGGIGRAVALALAARGWRLLLHARSDTAERSSLASTLDRMGAQFEFVVADLASNAGRHLVSSAISARQDVEAIVHCASPAVTSDVHALVAVNYIALRAMADAALPTMLKRQRGVMIGVGSTAMMRTVPGMEDYAAAKTMATTVLARIERNGSAFGVRGLNLMPGFVTTKFSAELRGDAPGLAPEEVAAAVLGMIDSPPDQASIVIEVGRRSEGTFGFVAPPVEAPRRAGSLVRAGDTGQASVSIGTAEGGDAEGAITDRDNVVERVVNHVLKPHSIVDFAQAGLGVTPGWDSFKQIEIVLALESALGITFSSAELSGITRFVDLQAACKRLLGGAK